MGARRGLLQTLGRTAVLMLWALAAWGTLLVVSALANALGEGAGPALTRLLPAAGASVWGWLGPFSVLLALGALILGATFVVARRWQAGGRPEE